MTDIERKRRLVIVDDEPVILQILTAVFEDGPWEITSCSNGCSAQEAMRSRGVDILLTDKNLPDINGLELMAEAKRINPLAEAILITAYASLESAISALELDAFDYVLKPLNNVFEIRKKIERAADKQRVAEENVALMRDLEVRNLELQNTLSEARRLQAGLVQSEKLAGIGTLAAGIAHEIASPLFGVLGLAEAIGEEDDISTIHEYGEEIVSYAKSIRQIVLGLSNYSRVSKREYLSNVNLHECVSTAVQLINRSDASRGVEINIRIPESINCDAQQNELQQIFVNLIRNGCEAALEAHPESGAVVVIHCEEVEGGALVTVVDNGVGIAPENHSSVFDPFFTTKEPGKGTGLGLNIVYRLLTKFGATISVDSVPGLTTFSLLFPSTHE